MLARAVAGLFLAVSAVASGADVPPERKPFPDLQLFDSRGGVQSLKDSLGQVTVVNFWATWCGPCRQELPELQKLYDELGGRGVAVLAVNLSSPREQVPLFLKRFNLSLPVYFLDEDTEAALNVHSLPTTVLLDAGGNIVNIWGGYSPDQVIELRQQTEGLLAGERGRGGK